MFLSASFTAEMIAILSGDLRDMLQEGRIEKEAHSVIGHIADAAVFMDNI